MIFQTSKKILTYSVVSVLMVSQASHAGLRDWGGNAQSIALAKGHPCYDILKMEQDQIEYMKAMQGIMVRRGIVHTAAGAAVSADSIGDGINQVMTGPTVAGAINIVGGILQGAKTIKDGSKAIHSGFNIASSIEERTLNLQDAIKNPNRCTGELKAAFLRLQIEQARQINKNFLATTQNAIAKLEGEVNIGQNAAITGASAVAAAAGLLMITKMKTSQTAPIFGAILGIVGVGGVFIGGSELFQDFVYDRPDLNSMKATHAELAKIDERLGEQLARLN